MRPGPRPVPSNRSIGDTPLRQTRDRGTWQHHSSGFAACVHFHDTNQLIDQLCTVPVCGVPQQNAVNEFESVFVFATTITPCCLWRRWVLGVCGSTRCSSLRESCVLPSVTRDGPIWPGCPSHPAVWVLLPTLTSGCWVPFWSKAFQRPGLAVMLYIRSFAAVAVLPAHTVGLVYTVAKLEVVCCMEDDTLTSGVRYCLPRIRTRMRLTCTSTERGHQGNEERCCTLNLLDPFQARAQGCPWTQRKVVKNMG